MMEDTELIERPANWLRCIALLDAESRRFLASGVIFPDGSAFLRWDNGVTTHYPGSATTMTSLENRGYACHCADIEVPLC